MNKRQLIWQHNGLQGRNGMAKAAMRSVILAPTTTSAAKAKAAKILKELEKLGEQLKERVNA